MFDQQHAGPKQIYKTIRFGFGSGELFNGMLKRGNAFIGDAKNIEEINLERFGFGVFAAGISPLLAES